MINLLVILSAGIGAGVVLGIVLVIGLWIMETAKSKRGDYKSNKALEKDPTNVKALLYKGRKNIERGNLDKGLDYLNEILKIDESHHESLVVLGIVYHLRKQYETSSLLIKKAMIYLFEIENDIMMLVKMQRKYGEDLALLFYCYGHLMHMDGNTIEADRFKKLADYYTKNTTTKYNLY